MHDPLIEPEGPESRAEAAALNDPPPLVRTGAFSPSEFFQTCPMAVNPHPALARWGAMLGAAALLGFTLDYFFWARTPGISVPVFVAIFHVVLFASRSPQAPATPRFAKFLFVPVYMLAGSFFLFDPDVLSPLNFGLLALLLLLQTVLVTGTNTYAWHMPRVGQSLLNQVLLSFPAIGWFAQATPRLGERREQFGAHVRAVLFGLALLVPLGLVLVQLLSNADPMFAGKMNQWGAWFSHLVGGEAIAALIRRTLLTAYFAGYFWLIWRSAPLPAEPDDAFATRPVIPPLTWITVIAPINFLYAVFCWYQCFYLFRGIDPTRATGLSFAEYAQRGFNELMIVAIVNTVLALVGIRLTKPGPPALAGALRVLLSLLLAASVLILVSAFMRLCLYEEGYGFSRIRLYAHTVMILTAFTLGYAALAVWRARFPFEQCFLVTALLLYCGMNYLPPDGFIARHNAARANAAQRLDTDYMSWISYDAVPALLGIPDAGPEINAMLARRLATLRADKSIDSWPSYSVSRARARRLLEQRFGQAVDAAK